MKKRVIAFTLTVNMLFLFLFGRLFYISCSPQTTSNQQSTRVRDIATSRGNIFDRNMNLFTNAAFSYVVCIKPTANALTYLNKANEDTKILKQLAEGRFVFSSTDAPEKYNGCEDIKCLPVYERYTDNSLAHILGYTDSSGNGICGIEKYFNETLNSNGGTLSVAFSADANGRMLSGEPVEIRDNDYYTQSGVMLTIDKKMQSILEKAMINGKIEKGAGIVLDTATNEILACASFPVYDRKNLGNALKDVNSPFINRAFSAFPVGSVYKVVTASAVLQAGKSPEIYLCNGSITLNGNTFYCSNLEGHGNINFETALAKSCNPYFIDLGVKTGEEKILSLSRKLGLGDSTDLGNGYMTDSGVLPVATEFKSKADIGNLSFGQGRLTATPLQIACIFSSIGNGGYYIKPALIRGTVDEKGKLIPIESHKKKEKILSDFSCNMLKGALSKTVTEGTGTPAGSNLYTCCTKTATAQSGQYDENGNEIKFCWFVGFFPKENPQYTICIMKEQGSSGGSDCGPVFKEIAENILFNF